MRSKQTEEFTAEQFLLSVLAYPEEWVDQPLIKIKKKVLQSVEEEVYKFTRHDPWHREGKLNREWILLDYVDVVAHVFKKDRRAFYDLEQLWGDAEIKLIDEATFSVAA